MGVPLKAVLIDQSEDFFHLDLIVDIIGEDVFIQRIPCGTVNVHCPSCIITEAAIQFTQEVPASFCFGANALFQHGSCPKDRSFRARVESFRIEQCRLVMVAQQTHVQIHHEVNALGRIRTVSDNVAQTVDLSHTFPANISQDGCQRFEVAVNIANQRSQRFYPDLKFAGLYTNDYSSWNATMPMRNSI